MKKTLSVLAGMVFILAFGVTAAADDMTPANNDDRDKMINNQDHQQYNLDQYPALDRNQGLVDQMPSKVPGAGGSAAGGRGTSDVVKGKNGSTAVTPDPLAPLEKNYPEPYDGGNGRGKNQDDPYKGMEQYDHDTYRY